MTTSIAITDLTTQALDGTGVFDKLMQTVVLYLNKEYSKNRIKGPDYSKLYLGTLDAVLGQSMNFLLQKDTAAQQANLLAAQVIGEGLKNTLLQAQINKLASDKALVDAQILNVPKQGAEVDAQTSLITAQKAKLAGVDTSLATAQINKTNAEKLLIDQQELKTIQDTIFVTNNAANELSKAAIITKQGIKLDKEASLLAQKADTEKAQILDTINTLPVAGVIGKQKNLFTNQADGFLRDAEQKLAKIAMDTYGIRLSIAGVVPAPLVGMDTPDFRDIIVKAKAGIGV